MFVKSRYGDDAGGMSSFLENTRFEESEDLDYLAFDCAGFQRFINVSPTSAKADENLTCSVNANFYKHFHGT